MVGCTWKRDLFSSLHHKIHFGDYSVYKTFTSSYRTSFTKPIGRLLAFSSSITLSHKSVVVETELCSVRPVRKVARSLTILVIEHFAFKGYISGQLDGGTGFPFSVEKQISRLHRKNLMQQLSPEGARNSQ